MSGYRLFVLFHNLRNHFNGSYKLSDYKYTPTDKSATVEHFNKKPDKVNYDRMAVKYSSTDLYYILIDSFVNCDIVVISDIDLNRYHNKKLEYRRKLSNATKTFNNDLDSIIELVKKRNKRFASIFSFKGGHPPILKMMLSDSIDIETFIILDSVMNLVALFDKNIGNDFTWKVERVRIMAYRDLIKFDLGLIRSTLNNKLKNNFYTT